MVPSKMNTRLNPIMNATPFQNILPLLRSRSSVPAPLINARYPGTNGKVHGAKKVRSPAKNDEMASPGIVLFNLQKLSKFWFVKPCYHFIINKNDWHAHLSTFLNHLIASRRIFRNVIVREDDTIFLEEFFSCVTEMASWC